MAEKPIVLVVDDEVEVANGIADIVKKMGAFEVVTEYSAKGAFEVLRKNKHWFGPNRVNLILLDIMMPDMDGLQFLEELRKTYRDEQIGVIMVTAYEDEEKWEKATDGFVAGYITKPFREEAIHSAVEKFFSDPEGRYKMTIATFEKHIEKMKEFKKK